MKNFKTRSRLSQILILLALFFIIIFLAGFIYQHWNDLLFLISVGFNPRKLEAILAERDLWDFLILVIITSLMSAVPFFSSSLIGVVNGLIFGPYLGSLINITGNSLGNVAVTLVLKRSPLKSSTKKLGNVIERLSSFKNKFIGLWLGYTIPMMPSFLVNYTAIKLSVPLKKQLICIILGVAPTCIIYACGGYAILQGNIRNLILIAVLILIPYSLYTFVHKRKIKNM